MGWRHAQILYVMFVVQVYTLHHLPDFVHRPNTKPRSPTGRRGRLRPAALKYLQHPISSHRGGVGQMHTSDSPEGGIANEKLVLAT